MATMSEYAKQLPSEYAELKVHALETRNDLPYSLASLRLPCYRNCFMPLGSFLETPIDDTLARINSDRYWLQFLPSNPIDPRITHHDIPRSELDDFIRANLPNSIGQYTLHLSEFADNICGGNIVVDPSGAVLAEFSEGMQTKVSADNLNPDFTAISLPGNSGMHYSFQDEKLRRHIWNLVRHVRELPGYYEFTVLKEKTAERPIFIDARLTNPIYRLPGTFFAA